MTGSGVTRLLNLAAQGDAAAGAEVLPLVYQELKRIAKAKRPRATPGETLSPTALVHEAYLRLVGKEDLSFNGRHHFYCSAARAMHDLLVEEARRKASKKRGGGARRVDLEEIGPSPQTAPEDLVALHDALEKLRARDERDHEVVMLRYFTGLTIAEIAGLLGLTTRTVERRWRFCRSWLTREIGGSEARA